MQEHDNAMERPRDSSQHAEQLDDGSITLHGTEPPSTEYVTVPEGTYLCKIAEVRKGTTRSGDPRWGLRLVVDEGNHIGKLAAWDGLVFSTRGLARVRRVLAALGLPSKGRVRIDPTELEGRSAFVEIRRTEYVDAKGELVKRTEVPYDGYLPVPEERGSDPADPPSQLGSDSIPF